jgi:hypothetical protein
MSNHIDTTSSQILATSNSNRHINTDSRLEIALQAIGGNLSVTHIADNHDVSRKFVYAQRNLALRSISKTFFQKLSSDKNEEVLFYLPVTKNWLIQVVLALLFICRGSYQSIVEFFRDIFDYPISKGTVHNIVYASLQKAKNINSRQDLSKVEIGLHDEIYQAGKPVLVGCCDRSTFCYLLKLEASCDSTSWGVHLLDLQQKQKLNPDFTILDGGTAARAGQKEAWPEIPAHSDVFHALKPFSELSSYLERRSSAAFTIVSDLEKKIKSRRGIWKDTDKRFALYQKLLAAEKAWQKADALAEDIKTLEGWLKKDILSQVGPSYNERKELLQFVIEQLSFRESLCEHKIRPVYTYLLNHCDDLLKFVLIMDMYFAEIAQEFDVPLYLVLEVYQLKKLHISAQEHSEMRVILQNKLGYKFYWLESLVDEVLKKIPRANSLVENLNSRLRTYFTLRRELGNEYLAFLQFFLNHRRFMRSECLERVGKSPTELLTGESHEHWLKMLGFSLFKQAA